MKLLFVVQGEGRGHLTQALVMSDMLRQRGDQIVAVLVGKSPSRRLPEYFTNKINAPVYNFESPNFLPTSQNKRPELLKSILSNVKKISGFYKSMCFIRTKIEELQPDMVINFYELMTGLTYLFMPPYVPQVCIGHQYLFLHEKFRFPRQVSRLQLISLRFFTRLTCLGAKRKLALSFYPLETDTENDIIVIPPLIRREIRTCETSRKDYILGYLLNSGYISEVQEWQQRHPEMNLHFFWDRKDADDTCSLTPGLTMHRINDTRFIDYMAGCKAYATTAGFESICEALYLQKPVLMIPVHIEQECNAFDAYRAGAGLMADSFALDRLLHLVSVYQPNTTFREWAKQAESRIYSELCEIRHTEFHWNKNTLLRKLFFLKKKVQQLPA